MFINLHLCFLLFLQYTLVSSHAHKRSAHELHLDRKRYDLQHRAFITKCNEKIRARRLKRALSLTPTLHPARQQSLLQELATQADNATTNPTAISTNSSSCVLDGEVTQGPYHVLGELIRQNITEGQGGVPVTFDVDFVDFTTCEPLKNAWIDLWHANATGYYSGFTSSTTGMTSTSGSGGPFSKISSEIGLTETASPIGTSTNSAAASTLSITIASAPQSTSATGSAGSSPGGGGGSGMGSTTTDELSFDRGIWKTDEEGHFTMYDTVPGWYTGRAVHTHIKVYDETSGYQAENGTFIANNSAYHTGQWFYPQDFLALLANLSPYSDNTLSYADSTKNSEDDIYPDAAANGNQAEMTITWINSSDVMAGVIASTVVGVNLTYSSVESGGYYWIGNITQAKVGSNSTTGTSSASDGSAASVDGVTNTLSMIHILTVILLAGATASLMSLM